ncbi:MAG: hypothetical protein AAF218_04010, partial [Pseudomonadota bacterium]
AKQRCAQGSDASAAPTAVLMPRQVVLHIGFHKTGTSSVQAVLRANRAALKRHVAIRLKPQIKELLHGARGYSTWRDGWSLAKTQRRWDALLAGLPAMPRRVLIVSAEELAGHMPGRGALADYSAAVDLTQVYVDGVRARFPEAEITVHVGLRQAEDWLRSAYWEHVKSSSMVLDEAEFVAHYRAAADLAAVADRIAEQAGVPVHHAWLEHCGAHPLGPAAALLAGCAVPQELLHRLTPAPVQNTRLPVDVLQALLAANRSYADRDARKAAKRSILKEAEIIRPNNLARGAEGEA